MTRKGPRKRAGVACLVRSTRPKLMVCDTVYRFRCHESLVVPSYLEIALNSPDVVHAIDRQKAGNPCNLLLSLYHVAWQNDYSRCATAEVCVEDEGKKEFRVFASGLAWNGEPVSKTPENIVEDVYGCFEMWCADSPRFEDSALSAHNLSTPIVEFQFKNQDDPSMRAVVAESGEVTFKSLAKDSLPTLEGFETRNRDYP